jgi:hypothetical protein
MAEACKAAHGCVPRLTGIVWQRGSPASASPVAVGAHGDPLSSVRHAEMADIAVSAAPAKICSRLIGRRYQVALSRG